MSFHKTKALLILEQESNYSTLRRLRESSSLDMYALLAILSIIVSYSAVEQNSARYWNPIHKTLTTNNGLLSMECYSTFQDSKGHIWVATDHGEAKYNGHTFGVCTTSEGPGSNAIYDIQEDKQGRIWFFSNVPELYFFRRWRKATFRLLF